LLRWLAPENGQPPEKWLPDEQLRQQIRVIVETGNTMDRLQNIAVSRIAGIRRVKNSPPVDLVLLNIHQAPMAPDIDVCTLVWEIN